VTGPTVLFVCARRGAQAGLPAAAHLDHSPPQPIAGDGYDLVVAVDCAVPGAHRWDLSATEVGEAMRDELRDRVAALAERLRAGRG
jgi:hypothetical protein